MPSEEKNISSVGGRLEEARAKEKIEIARAAQILRVPVGALEALEKDDYSYFSAKVYAVGILKKYAELLSIRDRDTLVQEFSNEWDIQYYHTKRELKPLPQNRGARPFLTPRRLWILIAVLFLICFLSFVSYRVFAFVRNPSLVLEEPAEVETRFSGRILQVKGSVLKESSLTVNGREITISSDGNFSDAVELRSGSNTLEFVAVNRFGKITRDTRYVFVE